MGLFSSKYVTQVATSTVRVIEDNAVPNSAKTGLIKALFYQGDMSEYMMDERVGSLANRAERMCAYGKDHYTYGLPLGQSFRPLPADSKSKPSSKASKASKSSSTTATSGHPMHCTSAG